MKRIRAFALLTLALSSDLAKASEPVEYPTLGTIERLEGKFDSIVPSNARIERLAEGFDWSEGPVWDKKRAQLLFSDVPRNTVFQWAEGRTSGEIFLKPSGYTGKPRREGEPGSNGLLMDSDGRLVLMQHGDRRVARLTQAGTFETMVADFGGKRLNSPNDGVFKSNGDLYFTDPPYGLPRLNDDPAKELPFSGVYRLTKAGELTLLTKELSFPNGIGFSPDERTLYVANSDPKRANWTAFPVKPDGTLGEGRVFFDASDLVGKKKGLPDGLKVDRYGHVFASGPGGILVFSPEGVHLGTFATGEATANCAWGGDGSTLYITADMFLARVKLQTRGLRY